MKEETIQLLEDDFKNEFKNKEKLFKRRIKRGYTYKIEYIPVLVERGKDDKCREIIFPQTRIIYESENK